MKLAHVLLTLSLGCSTGWGCADEADSGLDAESLIIACVRTAACGVKPHARLRDCLDSYQSRAVPLGLTPVLDPAYRCASLATSCAAIAACFGAGGACGRTYEGSCDGGRATFCDLIDDRIYSYDCGAAGLGCKLDGDNSFAAECTGPQSAGTLRRGLSCPTDGCTQTDESCATDELDRCTGSKLRSCLEGRWVEFDCDALGLAPCAEAARGTARCSPRG